MSKEILDCPSVMTDLSAFLGEYILIMSGLSGGAVLRELVVCGSKQSEVPNIHGAW